MAVPDPLWGVHVAPGTISAALVHRRDDGTWMVLETLEREAPRDTVGAVRAATALLSERGRAGRPAFLALPDHEGSVGSCVLKREEADRAPDELRLVLFGATHFYPEEAKLWHRPLTPPGAVRGFLIASVERNEANGFFDALAPLDARTYGIGFASLALAHGARAAGIVGPTGALVEVLPQFALVHALVGIRHRRYLLPVGSDELAAAETGGAAARRLLARDAVAMLRYHLTFAVSGHQPDIGDARALVLPVGAAAAGAAGESLRRALKPDGGDIRVDRGPESRADVSAEAAPAAGRFVRRSRRRGAAAPIDEASCARYAGALGAALLGASAPPNVPVIRSLPDDVPTVGPGCVPPGLAFVARGLDTLGGWLREGLQPASGGVDSRSSRPSAPRSGEK